jgi:hypothetical protein
MAKRPKGLVRVEAYSITDNGQWVRDDCWMSEKQLQGYADAMIPEAMIAEKKRRRPKPRP